MKAVGIIYTADHLYKIDEAKMQEKKISFNALSRMDTALMMEAFQDFCKWAQWFGIARQNCTNEHHTFGLILGRFHPFGDSLTKNKTPPIRAGICFSGTAGMQADPYDLPKTICQNGRKAI